MGISRDHPGIKKLLERAANPEALKTPNNPVFGRPGPQTGSRQKETQLSSEESETKKPAARTAGVLNKTETEFYRIAEKEWDHVLFEKILIPINRRNRCEYTPDALCMKKGQTPCFYEVKGGFWRDDARVKTNIASRLVGPALFKQAIKKKKSEGDWEISPVPGTPFSPGNTLEGENSLGISIHFSTHNPKTDKYHTRTLKIWPLATVFLPSGGIQFHLTTGLLSQSVRNLKKGINISERKSLDPRALDPARIPELLHENFPPMIEWLFDTANDPKSTK